MVGRGVVRGVLIGLTGLLAARAEGAALADSATFQPPFPLTPVTFGARELPRCLRCHGQPGFFARDSLGGRIRYLSIAPAAYTASAHGALLCTQCHPEVKAFPHRFEGGRRPKRSCDADCHAADSLGRAITHRTEWDDLAASAHRDGPTGKDPDDPACLACHGRGDAHAIAWFKGRLSRAQKMELCAPCHEDGPRMVRHKVAPDAVATYRRSFHYKAQRQGWGKTAVCQDCHGVHRVIAADSTASSVNPAHLVQTCGQKDCHSGARLAFAMSGANHLGLRERREPLLRAVSVLFVAVSVGVIAVLAAGVALDIVRRLRARGSRLRAWAQGVEGALVRRVTLATRLEHGVMMVAFTVLAFTGVPLRFPEDPALQGLYRLIGGVEGARAAHRVAAAALALSALAHLARAAVLLVRARFDLARAWPMWPRARDLREVRDTVRYHLGRSAAPGAADRFDFRQKIHYLAVAWGVPVMVLSGLVLWFPVAVGGRLPDLAIGIAMVAHGDEALLAIAVVIVWHLYNVHLSPGTHHRFMTWLDGRITRAQWMLEHPREAERVTGRPVTTETRVALIEEAWAPRERAGPAERAAGTPDPPRSPAG